MSESPRIPTRVAHDSDATHTPGRSGFRRDASRERAPAPATRPDPSKSSHPSTATQESKVERAGAIEASGEIGNRRLRAYLNAHPKIRERFDGEQARSILAEADTDHRVANELADDPIHQRVQFERWLREQDA